MAIATGRSVQHVLSERSCPRISRMEPMEIDCRHSFRVLSYNVWLYAKEVTENILRELRECSFWKHYYFSDRPINLSYFVSMLTRRDLTAEKPDFSFLPYHNSEMGRGLLWTKIEICGKPLVIGTTHLESPLSGRSYVESRSAQLKSIVAEFSSFDNAILAGDLNWTLEDGPLILPPGWIDAWTETNPDLDGATFDTDRNSMIKGMPHKPSRLDRTIYKAKDYEATTMYLLGTEPIGAIAEMKNRGRVYRKQAFPSDHYGILTDFKKITEL